MTTPAKPAIDPKAELLAARRPKPVISAKDFVGTGSTLLNLLISGRAKGGYVKGKYVYVVGDSTSGKTWITLTCMAEASVNPNFANYTFYHDNVEDGALMDLEFYFGKKAADRIRAPSYDADKNPVYSSTVESFYYHMDTAIARSHKTGKPFIYVLDSQDSLDSKAAAAKFQEQKEAFEEGKDTAGSYGDGKAKVHSENIRRVLQGLRDTNSILIVIGQTRDNLGMGNEKTRSGGKALRFYASIELWTSVKETIKKSVRGKERTIGTQIIIQCKKNRVTGVTGAAVTLPIYNRYGIDDIGSSIDYLLSEQHWKLQSPAKKVAEDEDDEDDTPETTKKKKASKIIPAIEFNFEGTREELIAHIEQAGLEDDLRELVGDVWGEIADASLVRRKPRYA